MGFSSPRNSDALTKRVKNLWRETGFLETAERRIYSSRGCNVENLVTWLRCNICRSGLINEQKVSRGRQGPLSGLLRYFPTDSTRVPLVWLHRGKRNRRKFNRRSRRHLLLSPLRHRKGNRGTRWTLRQRNVSLDFPHELCIRYKIHVSSSLEE